MTATLYGLYYSPWTIRAKWALDHHAVDYRNREHVIFLGEPMLRWRAGTRRASVPLYVDGARRLGDSVSIMQHADAIGEGESLRTDSPEVRAWVERFEPALAEARARVTRRTLRDPEALTEAAASATPTALAPLFRPVAAMGARHVARKYGFEVATPDDDGAMTPALDALRDAIGDGPYVQDRFGGADIIAATFLQGLRPVEGFIELGPATARAWTDDALADRYGDLLEWRDALFARHWSHPPK